MPFGWGESHDAYQQVYDDNQPNQASLSHELIAGGASFAAFKAFEDDKRKKGEVVNHQFAKEALVGLAGLEVDRLAETKGADAWDREKAKHEARKNVQNMYDEHYGDGNDYDPNQNQAPGRLQQQFGGCQFGSSLHSPLNRPAIISGREEEERRIGSRDVSRTLGSEARREEVERKDRAPEAPKLAARPSDSEEDTSKCIDGVRTQYQQRCLRRYGSIIGSPLHGNGSTGTQNPRDLELPGPAISLSHASPAAGFVGSALPGPQGEQISAARVEQIHHLTGLLDSSKSNHSISITKSPGCRPSPKRGRNKLQRQRPKRKIPNCSSSNPASPWAPRATSIHIDTFKETELRRGEFLAFLDEELAKIGAFYKQKEDEATYRLQVLKDQLHILRDQRVEEAKLAKRDKLSQRSHRDQLSQDNFQRVNGIPNGTRDAEGRKPFARFGYLKGFVGSLKKATCGRGRKLKKSRQIFGTSATRRCPGRARDHSKRPTSTEISYRTAKRKLEEAMAEYYRGLELLRSYAVLNRKAFQKINKKYNKMANARPLGGYVSEKVNTTYFATRGVLDNHIRTVEDLYARYFERGNRKSAVGKLRAQPEKSTTYDASLFRSGLLIAAGVVFGIHGLMHAIQLRSYPDPDLVVNTGYLLQVWHSELPEANSLLKDIQIYGGYSLMLLLMTLFVFGCRVWSVNKINYAFVFEFPTRHYHNWRQLLENTTERKALFIAFATVNATYSSIWDLVIDWSLGDPHAQHPFLRDVLGLKAAWPYYVAMLLDPLLRFTWVFYAIYSHDLQDSALTSFIVALAEVFRRSLWVIFRIENEHCTNVGLFRASRDVALPYEIDSPSTAQAQRSLNGNTLARSGLNMPLPDSCLPNSPSRTVGSQAATEAINTRTFATPATHPDLEAARPHEDSPTPRPTGTEVVNPMRRPNLRRGIPYSNHPPIMHRLSQMSEQLSNAHSQDYERRNKPGVQMDEEDDEERGVRESEEGENSEDKDSEEDAEEVSNRMGRMYRGRSIERERARDAAGAAKARWNWI
ncbi:MAG: hypothetical protein Q9165_003211 [Trypethelium subeluteriae]